MAEATETVEQAAETQIEPAAHEPAPKIPESTKESLAEKIQSSFDAAMGNETDDDEPAASEEGDKPQPAETEPQAEKEETTEPAEAAAKPASTLPAAYVRTLKALEWSDEEIASAGQNPALLPSIAKLHQSRNKEMAGWAELGRQQKAKAQEQQPAAQSAATKAVLQAFTPAEVAALKEKYGDDAGGLIDTLTARLNPLIEKVTAALPVVEQTQARAQQAQAEMLNRQINGFFSSKELVPYKEEYGTDAAKLTDKQLGTRQKVLEYADALIGGASMQGRQLSFEEAMQAAHDAVSGGLKEQAARTKVISQLQQRERAITVKPGARQAPKTATAKTRGELETRVKRGLAEVLG